MISVIIPHFNQPVALERCLRALKHQASGAFVRDIIVVDNGSRELPVDVCSAFAGVTLLLERERGPGPARNRGAAYAHGDILAFIDADCIPGEGWLAAIGAAFREDPSKKILGGDVRIARASAKLSHVAAYESVFAFRMDKYIAKQGFTGSGNLAVRREVFERVGPFRGIEVAEDRDWGRRATAIGYAISFERAMIAYHPSRETFDELARKWDRHISHDFADRKLGFRGNCAWTAKALAIAGSPAVSGIEVLTTDRLARLPERAGALFCLGRIRFYRAGKMLKLLFVRDSERLVWD